LDVGTNATVTLVGKSGITYPAIYEHWRTITIYPGATLNTVHPGTGYAFSKTAGVPEKRINVMERGTIAGTNIIGPGPKPILDELGSGYVSHFYAAPGSFVKLTGHSNKAGAPVVNLRNRGSSFELDRPALYDLRNDLNGNGGRAVNIGPDGNFIIRNSDIAVWDSSMELKDLDGTPDVQWSNSTLVANNQGTALDGTNDPRDMLPSLRYSWNTTKYSRITNQPKSPPFLPPTTNMIGLTYKKD